ncbi:MAG: enoyl-CoA hydratase/isomerase family protein [Pseudomonadota bacterium]|nr:enoyl-CoA hydratase/isomerase family protein [Pseudomonadota bacterium]
MRTETPTSSSLATAPASPALAIDGAVATITLRRPATHNRIEPEDLGVLRGYLAELEANRDVRVIVFASTGTSFSSGFDLGRLGASAASGENQFQQFTDDIENARAITIARLHGPVYGGSTDLTLACDFRIGVEGMRMFMPAARLGLHYYPHGLRRWVSRLGLGAAKRLFLTSRTLQAEEMLRIGYLDALVPPDSLDTELRKWIDELLAQAPIPLVTMKATLNEIGRMEYDEASAQAAHVASLKTRDIAEALAAFAEKRTPRFTGA